jgi:hypothetical protein
MAACAHGAGYAKCPPMKVAAEFNMSDKGTGMITPKSHRDSAGRSADAMVDSYISKRYGGHKGG